MSGTGPRLEYLSDSTFRGQDTFTYKAAHAGSESNTATVTIDVIQEAYSSDLNEASSREIYVHVPSHIVTADVYTQLALPVKFCMNRLRWIRMLRGMFPG